MNTNLPIDVLGLGCVAVDDLVYVDSYPPPDAKVPVSRTERQCGGLTATALVAAARLGAQCAYAGVTGTDELSSFALNAMAAEGVVLDHSQRLPEARVVHSFIVVDSTQRTRTIFANLNGAIGAGPTWPDPEVIRNARVLFVDQFGLTGMIRAATIAREAGKPVVGDLENPDQPGFTELLSLIDHLIVSESFALRITRQSDISRALCELQSDRRSVVVITAGAKGCWFTGEETDGRVRHQPAFPVEAVDTTGCGDVFHGAYAAGLALGIPLKHRILKASAAAALKATLPGGQAGIPNHETVETFLKDRAPDFSS